MDWSVIVSVSLDVRVSLTRCNGYNIHRYANISENNFVALSQYSFRKGLCDCVARVHFTEKRFMSGEGVIRASGQGAAQGSRFNEILGLLNLNRLVFIQGKIAYLPIKLVVFADMSVLFS
jgi:hypothetical protein